MYVYRLVVLERGPSHRYYEAEIDSWHFTDAFQRFLLNNKDLVSKNLEVFCRRATNNLQFMAQYDGKCISYIDGELIGHTLRTAEGKSYTFTDEGFLSTEFGSSI